MLDFKPIQGFEGYSISILGLIRRDEKTELMSRDYYGKPIKWTRRKKEKILVPQGNRIKLYKNGAAFWYNIDNLIIDHFGHEKYLKLKNQDNGK
jgi:hypothetical protein